MNETPDGIVERPPLHWWRRVIAFIGAALMLLGGGIGLLCLGIIALGDGGDKEPAFIFLGLVFGGIPLIVGFLIWWPAANWGRP